MTQFKQKPSGAAKAPTFIAYHVREVEEGKSFWTKIGAAWAHKDGKGFNIQIDMVPLDGRISLRSEPKETVSEQ